MPTYWAAARPDKGNSSPNPNPDIQPFEQKIGTTVTPALRKYLFFSTLFGFRVRSPHGTDGQTDGRTGETCIAAYQVGRTV